jgi:hypothetical protein
VKEALAYGNQHDPATQGETFIQESSARRGVGHHQPTHKQSRGDHLDRWVSR